MVRAISYFVQYLQTRHNPPIHIKWAFITKQITADALPTKLKKVEPRFN